jgi:hypothetical protein
VKVSIQLADVHVYEIRNSLNKSSDKSVQTYVQFGDSVTYHGQTISADAVVKCLGTGLIVTKGTNLYAFSGFEEFSSPVQEEEKVREEKKMKKKRKKNGG